jgi:WD40 repeat protein
MNRSDPSFSSALLCLLAILFSLTSACASRGPVLTEAASPYHPARLASDVPARPGSIAWSPDGKLIAWAGKQLTVYNGESGKQTLFPVADPRFLAWSPDGLLYILTRDANDDVFLSSLDAVSSRVTVLACVEADAVRPLPDGRGVVLLSADVKPLSMGTQINTRIVLQNLGTKRSRTLYRLSKTAMVRNPDAALWTGWLHGGVNPLDDSIFVLEPVVAPLGASYTRVVLLDSVAGEMTGPDIALRKRYLSGSWSPDGRRLALTDNDGRIEIRGRTGDAAILDPSVSGMYPSWNPAGSRIYAGGFLVDSDGTNREQLLTGVGAIRSVAAWSPDGTMLAVAADGELLLFRDMPAVFRPPDGPLDKTLAERLSLLRNLLLEGSISREEYLQRRNRLMGTTGAAR